MSEVLVIETREYLKPRFESAHWRKKKVSLQFLTLHWATSEHENARTQCYNKFYHSTRQKFWTCSGILDHYYEWVWPTSNVYWNKLIKRNINMLICFRCDTSTDSRSHLPHHWRYPRLLHVHGSHSRTGGTRIHCSKCVCVCRIIFLRTGLCFHNVKGTIDKKFISNKMPLESGKKTVKLYLYQLYINLCVFICVWLEILHHLLR